MRNSVEIALRGIPASAALETYIGAEARKLERICASIRSCQVVAEAQPPGRQQGAPFAARLIVTLPGTEIVVNREHGGDVYMALREAFAAAGLQLENHMRRDNIEPRPGNGQQNSRS